MTKPDDAHEKLMRELATLKLARIAEIYREVLDEAARKNSPMLEVLSTLIAEEAIARSQRALQRRIRQARLPKHKTLQEYDFTFPKRMPKQKILRLFDCQFIEQHLCVVFIGPTGTGKTHLLTALGYTACETGISVRFTRVVDMINVLTTAQINGTLEKALKAYVNPSLLLLDELGYLPITFGIGVDYAVNIMQRYRRDGPGSALNAVRETGGAVVLCSLTTILAPQTGVSLSSSRTFMPLSTSVRTVGGITRPDPSGGIIDRDMPIDASNVMIVCSKCGPTRIGHRFDDRGKHRICRKCGGDLK